MNWRRLISLAYANMRKPEEAWRQEPVVLGDFAQNFGVLNVPSWSDEFAGRMVKHWVASWICTDTRVGLAVYMLDGVPVVVSSQECRKCEEVLEFATTASAALVMLAIVQYMQLEGHIGDIDEELNPDWFEIDEGAKYVTT